jgi:hypothetical protein
MYECDSDDNEYNRDDDEVIRKSEINKPEIKKLNNN